MNINTLDKFITDMVFLNISKITKFDFTGMFRLVVSDCSHSFLWFIDDIYEQVSNNIDYGDKIHI